MSNQSENRTVNSIRNATVGLGGKLISILVDFVARTVFIQLLGRTYLGAADLMTNILTVLSLSELGVGTAMLYALYKPVADGDEMKIRTLMRQFKRLYIVIGLAVAALGMCFYPFLHLIEGAEQIEHFDTIYLLYLAKSLVTYWFFACNGTLFVAYQKKYIQTAIETTTHILMLLSQIAVLLLTGNYRLYLVMAILWQMITQYALNRRAIKAFPYLKEKSTVPLDPEEKSAIGRNVFALSLYKIGTTVVTTTDSIILSMNRELGLDANGAYSNYMMVVNYIQQIAKAIFLSLTASIGNLHVTATPDKKHEVFYNISFVSYWFSGFCGVCCYVLINPFFALWLKDPGFLYPQPVVALIVFNFLIEGFYMTVAAYKDACGLYWKGKLRPVATAVLNLGISLWLVRPLGVAGVVIGTIASRLLTTWWFDACLLYKNVFFRSPARYFLRYGGYMLTVALTALATEAVCGLFDGSTIAGFIAMCAVCLTLPNAVFLLLFHRKPEFGYMMNIVKGYAKRVLHK